jgi:hypothetical protein
MRSESAATEEQLMRHRLAWLTTACVLLSAGCTFDVPVDPAGFFASLPDPFAGLGEAVEKALSDPLGSKPFPVLVGGDSERIFYATNLGDTRFNFAGPSNDIVIPGLLGPSNLYKYENNQRQMIHPLVPAGLFSGLTTDGVHAVYLAFSESEPPLPTRVVIHDSLLVEPRVLFDVTELDPSGFVMAPAVDDGRVAFFIDSMDGSGTTLRIEDVYGEQSAREIDVGHGWAFDLKGRQLVYEVRAADSSQLVLLDLSTEEATTTVLELGSSNSVDGVFLTNNLVVWSEWSDFGGGRIRAYEMASGTTHTWADLVAGRLTGAADTHFLTEESVIGDNGITERTVIRLHEVGGRERKLADFRRTGLSGQSRILGDRAVFVNPDRRIVTVPLSGGDRKSFKPF